MATVGQRLSAKVEFGGVIDPSWTGSVKSMAAGIGALENRSARLSVQQEKLAKRIKKAALAGRDVKELRKQYEELAQDIKNADGAQEKLNRSMRKARKMDAFKGAGRGMLKGMGKGAMTGLAWGAGGLLAGAAGAIASPIMLNAGTAEKAGLAQSYGVDAPTFMAWEGLGKQMGLNGENIGDLFEEYRNKVFDYKQDPDKGALHDAIPELGLKAGEFAGKSNQEQVEEILSRLLAMKDEQKAAGIADSIFGGEANKILTYMRLTGKSYQELMDQQRKYSQITKEGAAGAVAGNMAVSNLWTTLTSAAEEISGHLGGELAPAIENITDDLVSWFKGGGIQSVKGFITDDLIPGFVKVGHALSIFGQGLYWLAKKLEFFFPDDYTKKESVLKTLAQTGSADLAAMVAKNAGVEDWFNQDVAGNTALQERVKSGYINSKNWLGWSDDEKYQSVLDKEMAGLGIRKDAGLDGMLADLSENRQVPQNSAAQSPRSPSLTPISDAAQHTAAGPEISVHNENKPTIYVYQQPGEDGKALADRVGLAFKDAGAGSSGGGFSSMSDPAWGLS